MDNALLKHFLIMLLISLVLLIGLPYCQTGLKMLLGFYLWGTNILSHVLANSRIAIIVRDLIIFLLLPIIITSIIAFMYWIFKRKQFPFFTNVCWSIWLVLATTVIMRSH